MKPLIVFYTLLRDSDYWKGLLMGDDPVSTSIRQPLMGTSLSAGAAGALARELDGLPTLHYPLLSLGTGEEEESASVLLGVGGMARIYRGRYDGRDVAIKLIFCMELCPSDVTAFASEANKMHQLRDHPNVIKLFGVCVRPPSLALVMEYAQFGSLHSVLHPPAPPSSAARAKRAANAPKPPTMHGTSLRDPLPLPHHDAHETIDNKSSMSINMSSSLTSIPTATAPTSTPSATLPSSPAPCHAIRLTHRNRLLMAMMCARGVAFMHSQRPPILHLVSYYRPTVPQVALYC
jgi:hypothetical protein